MHLYLFMKRKKCKKKSGQWLWLNKLHLHQLSSLSFYWNVPLSRSYDTREQHVDRKVISIAGMHKYSVDENMIMLLGRNDSFSITSTTQMCTCTPCKPKLLIPLAAFFILTAYFHEDREVWIRHLISSLWSFLLCFSAVSLLITSITLKAAGFSSHLGQAAPSATR